MRIHRLFCVILLLACPAAFAATNGCVNGRGDLERPLWDGYTLKIGATDDAANPCYGGVIGKDGKPVFEIWGSDVTMEHVTGRDVNNDGKPDVVLLSHNPSAPQNVYSIIGTVDPPGLIKQIVTRAALSFEDRQGDGHMEIVTRDTSFREFDGLEPSQSPQPLIFLRLKGKEFFNVSHLYWSDYEREVAVAKGKIGRDDIANFKGEQTNSGAGIGTKDPNKPKEETPAEIAHKQDGKALILEIVVDQIYGGHGQEAWASLKEMWPYADRDRIRQEILRARMNGVLKDINRPAPKQASAQ